jgi:DNA replication protein DnaC
MTAIAMDTTKLWRRLTETDLVRMRIPRRYWWVRYEGIPDGTCVGSGVSARKAAHNYLTQIDEMRHNGMGLLLWGTNGTGKTCMAIVVAKEYRRHGYPVLFIEAADIKRFVIEREMFDEDQTFWDRAMNVDVLVIDDLGKGVQDSTGFGARMIDELIRHRNASKLVTLITTNMNQRDLAEELKVSTMSSLKEHVFPIHVTGIDRRDAVASGIAKTLFDQ